MKNKLRLLLYAACASVISGNAADRADLEETTIRGNRELPKVLYIVPWKQPVTGELVGKPVKSLLDEVLAPVDRDVFRRQVEYYNSIQAQGAQAPAAKK